MNICVFCASSDLVDREYIDLAEDLGRRLGEREDTLVFGGGSCGLMGAVARAAKAAGSPRVVGIYPKYFDQLAEPACDEHIRTEGLRDRIALMETEADAFIALPGGIGTLHEVFDQLAPQSLDLHHTPIILLNHNGFYDKLLAMLDDLIAARFMQEHHRDLYFVADTVGAALEFLNRQVTTD